MRYDEMGRMIRRSSTGCVSPIGYLPPQAVDDEFGYDARGNLVGMRNSSIGLVRSLNRLVREIDDRFGTGVAYQYDRAGRMVSKVLPDGTTIQASYDAAGRVVAIADPFGDLTQFSYDAAGRTLARSSRSSELRTEYAYDGLGRLASVESFRADEARQPFRSTPCMTTPGTGRRSRPPPARPPAPEPFEQIRATPTDSILSRLANPGLILPMHMHDGSDDRS